MVQIIPKSLGELMHAVSRKAKTLSVFPAPGSTMQICRARERSANFHFSEVDKNIGAPLLSGDEGVAIMKDFGTGIRDRFVILMDWVLIAALVICASTIVARQLGLYAAPPSHGAEVAIS